MLHSTQKPACTFMRVNLEHINALSLKEITGTITEAEKAVLHQSIAESEDARLLYEHLHQTQEEPRHQPPVSTEDMPPSSPTRKKRVPAMAAAAILLLAAGLGGFMLWKKDTPVIVASTINASQLSLSLASGQQLNIGNRQGPLQFGNLSLMLNGNTIKVLPLSAATPEWVTLRVPNGKDYKVELQDGSVIWLNAASTVSFPVPFNKDNREATVSGEAYFSIAGNARRPFRVKLPHTEIQVLGTTFNINAYQPGRDVVALISGSIRVKNNRDSQLVKPGVMAISDGQHAISMVKFEAEELLAWRDGIQLLDAAGINEVKESIHRNFGIPVTVQGNETRFPLFTGVIERKKPVTVFLDKLKEAEIISSYHYTADSTITIQ